MLVDSHTHLDSFGDQIPEVLAAARSAGVGHIVVCGLTLENSERVLELARAHPDLVSAAAGWHPWHVREPLPEETYAALRRLILSNRQHTLTVGELGLDYSEAHVATRDAQLEVFCRLVRLGRELAMPMTIHVRGPAHADAMRIFEEEHSPDLKGALHGFNGSEAEGRRYLELGMLLAAGRMLVLGPDAEQLRDVFRRLPLEQMILETDAVYNPSRDFNPGPAYVRDVAQVLAEVKGVTVEEVERVTTANFEELVGARLG